MSWLTASDYLVMTIVAHERMEDLRVATTAAAGGDEAVTPSLDPVRCRIVSGGVRGTRRVLQELRSAR